MRGIPPGILIIKKIRDKDWSWKTYRYVVLLVTFVAYACYHASRKPSSIVKSVLDPGHGGQKLNSFPWPVGEIFVKKELSWNNNNGTKGGWEPFNEKDGTLKLGEIDVAFLACYSIGMYIAGHLGDSLDLRLFLTIGMMGSGIFVALSGIGYLLNIHAFWFYLTTQMIAGFFQATGWPSVVAVIGNWFDRRKRGLIMGVWNAHTSVGNITGSLLAASVLNYGWGWSFILPGALIFLGGIMVYLFLPAYPEDVGFPCPAANTPVVTGNNNNGTNDEESLNGKEVMEGDDKKEKKSGNRKSVPLLDACLIPGVIPFALCLFFAKFVAYTFLYWLPFYISQTGNFGQLPFVH